MPTDLATLVNYEFLYTLELRHPSTDEPTGVVFKLRSAASDVVKEIQRKHSDKNIERRMKNKMVKGITVERQELERVAACIASWDWGEQTYKGKKPELTMKTAMDMLDETSWIYQQVVEAIANTENFMAPSQTPSASTSS